MAFFSFHISGHAELGDHTFIKTTGESCTQNFGFGKRTTTCALNSELSIKEVQSDSIGLQTQSITRQAMSTPSSGSNCELKDWKDRKQSIASPTQSTTRSAAAANPTASYIAGAVGEAAGLAELVEEFEGIFLFGRKVWDVVLAGKSIVDLDIDQRAHVVPPQADCWSEFSSWNRPRTYDFNYKLKNGLGLKVIDYSFQLVFTPGGKYNGKGQYLRNVMIIPKGIYTFWMWSLSSMVEMHEPVNVGERDDPVAGLQLTIHIFPSTAIYKNAISQSVFVNALGDIYAM